MSLLGRVVRSTTCAALAFALAGCDETVGPEYATLVVDNASTAAVESIYVRPCGGFYGDDMLEAGEVVLPDWEREFALNAGCYDLYAEFVDLTFAEEREVRVEDRYRWTLTD